MNCLCGSVAKASDTQAVGHGFDPRPDHYGGGTLSPHPSVLHHQLPTSRNY